MTSAPLAVELRDLACRLAVEAGDGALAGRRGADAAAPVPGTKSSATDLVTVHDQAAEALIVAGLHAARPADGIVGEEGTDRTGSSGVSWFVDPIDGTTNFVYDLPPWSTSIAAGDADGMLAGAVYCPVLGELFAASLGGGATLNGRPIRCSEWAIASSSSTRPGRRPTPRRLQRSARVPVSVRRPKIISISRASSPREAPARWSRPIIAIR